mmetsp:Transcript_2227/g.2724  ORF Transcript_2227/g.2724 Transcript_2227/m.2724 type:complete len:85 (-) Transcript_2227:702-956(-)
MGRCDSYATSSYFCEGKKVYSQGFSRKLSSRTSFQLVQDFLENSWEIIDVQRVYIDCDCLCVMYDCRVLIRQQFRVICEICAIG